MKFILQLLTGAFFLPFLILGGVIAVVRVLLTLTFGMAWQKGDDWYGALLCKVNDYMQRIKTK